MSEPGKSLGVVIVLGVTIAPAVRGQRMDVQPGVGLSLTIPTGSFHADQFGDGFKVGWRGTALVDFRSPASHLGLRISLSYGESGSNDKLNADLSLQNPATTVKTKLLGGTVDLTYTVRPLSRGVAAYLFAGGGAYDVSLCTTTSGSFYGCSSVMNAAWNIGVGASHRIGTRAAFFVDARYLEVGGVTGFYGPQIKPSFLSLMAGIKL